MKNVTLKVSSKSSPNSVAGAIIGILNEGQKVQVDAVGAAAVNQAVKAIAIARGYIAPEGKNLVCIPAFTIVNIDNSDRTGIKFLVKEED